MLELVHISKSFVAKEYVLDEISFEVQSGDLISLLGSNGSGKSTLLKILAGFYKADYGYFSVDKIRLSEQPAYKIARHIHYLAQSRDENLPSSLTLLEAFMICLTNSSYDTRMLSSKKWKQKVFDILSPLDLKLEKKIHQQIRDFSGGEYQVISLLLMIELIKQNKYMESVLLLDEHTAHLDEKMEGKVMDLTVELIQRHQITTIMVTHNIETAVKYSKRILLIKNGKIAQDINLQQYQPEAIKNKLAEFFR